MKKFITLIFVCISMLFSLTCFAQLKVVNTDDARGYKTVHKIQYPHPSSNGEIRYSSGTYFLVGVTDNQFEKSMASIILGNTKDSAIQSLKDLQSMRSELPKDGVYVPGLGSKKTHIYKLRTMFREMVFSTDGICGITYVLTIINFEKAIKAIENFNEE